MRIHVKSILAAIALVGLTSFAFAGKGNGNGNGNGPRPHATPTPTPTPPPPNCTPSCTLGVCGYGDGCGGTCGCPEGTYCSYGQCIPPQPYYDPEACTPDNAYYPNC
jgi:hypothetical protein